MKQVIFNLIFFLTLVVMGCNGPAGPALTGKITGYIYAVDDHNTFLDRSGVKIELQGTGISTVSDQTGRWVLGCVKTGIYTVVFSKSGFGTYKLYSLQFVGGGDLYLDPDGAATIAKLPSYTVTSLQVQFPDSLNVELSGTVSDTTSWTRGVIVYIGKANLTSSDPVTNLFEIAGFTNPNANTFQITYPKSTFINQGLSIGGTVYLAAYAWSYAATSYRDPVSARIVQPSVGRASVTANFVMP